MTGIYKENFEKIKKAYKDIFEALERAFKGFDMDFYLIGAQSRDVWTDHLNLIKRTTRDIDYCVYVPDYETWKALTIYLVNEEGFMRDPKAAHRFEYGKTIVDLLPFGGIEKNGEVVLQDPTIELSVYACMEVTEEAVVIEGGFKVITLPGLCIMKLIAFNEKPDWRAKDLDDFIFILTNYGEIAGDELFDGGYEDLIVGDFEMEVAAARMLGRHIATIVNKNPELKDKVIEILRYRIRNFTEKEINEMYDIKDERNNQTVQRKLIAEAIKGINDLKT